MSRIATDVVLLPDEATMDRAIEINKELIRRYRPEIVLNKRTCLPHISLAMGCVEQEEIEAIGSVLERVASEQPVADLRIVGLETAGDASDIGTSLLVVERTEPLQELHETVMREMKPFFTHDVADAMIHDDLVAGSTLEWIRNYPEKASYEAFRPHITLGYGQVEGEMQFPVPLGVARLAICHLGNHCTCRKVLASVSL